MGMCAHPIIFGVAHYVLVISNDYAGGRRHYAWFTILSQESGFSVWFIVPQMQHKLAEYCYAFYSVSLCYKVVWNPGYLFYSVEPYVAELPCGCCDVYLGWV